MVGSGRRARRACRQLFFAGAIAGALGATACADAGDQSAGAVSPPSSAPRAVDDAGRLVQLTAPARRVISLLPAVTETLLAMGSGDLLVARTDYDEGMVEHLPSVGGGLTPSLEVIASLRPDLVIVWEESGGARLRPRLEGLGLATFAAQTRDTADIYANIQRLGALTGRAQQADSLARWMRAELAAVAASVAGRTRPRVLYLIGVDPYIVAGPNLFIGEVLSVAGGENLFPEVEEASPQMSLEEIVRRRPEVVLLPSSGPGSAAIERLVASPGWAELSRSGGTRFQAIPVDLLHRPGPGVAQAAWILRDALYPELAGTR